MKWSRREKFDLFLYLKNAKCGNPLWDILKYFSLFLFYVFDVFPACFPIT